MPEPRVQLTVEIETEGAEQLTALRRQLDSLGSSARTAFAPLDSSLATLMGRLRESRRLVGSLESVFGDFFRRLLGGARNFREAFKQLLLDLLQAFLRTVARMLDSWLSAFRQMQSVASAGFGGFGFPISVGTPPTFPTGGGGFSLGGVLASIGGAVAGPIGGLVGGVVGAIAGLFGGGSRRGPDAVDIQLEAQRRMMEVFNAYQNRRLTAPAAIGQIQSILQQAAQALAPRGKRGRGAMEILSQIASNHISNIRSIERGRQQRAAVIASLPVPEFQLGGLVRTVNAVDGRVLALLHPGEAVLNRRAVQALGAGRVQAINQAAGGSGVPQTQRGRPSFQGGGLVPAAAPLGAPAVNVGPIIVQGADDPQATADAVIREIRRRARDRGLLSPV